MAIKHEEQKTPAGLAPVKRPYQAPKLTVFGAVKTLTHAGATGSSEGSASSNPFMATSDRRVKENIVRVGEHPLAPGAAENDRGDARFVTVGKGDQPRYRTCWIDTRRGKPGERMLRPGFVRCSVCREEPDARGESDLCRVSLCGDR